MSTRNPNQVGQDAGRRRSQRVILSLPVIVRAEDATRDAAFEEETSTLVVNVHGALILLKAAVEKGQKLRLINRATREEEVCRVVYVDTASAGKVQVAIEFLKPSPDFWHIAFPPEDWSQPEPSSIK